jgi:hypothetical protein
MVWTVRSSNPSRVNIFISSAKRPDRLWGPSSRLAYWVPGLKRSGRDADQSPPSSAEVKNKWSYTSIPRICVRGVEQGQLVPFLLFKIQSTGYRLNYEYITFPPAVNRGHGQP